MGKARLVVVAVGLCAVAAVVWTARRHRTARPALPEHLETVSVARSRVEEMLTVAGDVDAAKRTRIDCEVENIPSPTSMFGANGITILWLIADGTTVRKGDVLCRLDDSAFVEMARQQEIAVEQAKAELRKATLDVETTKIGLRAFRDGEVAQETERLKGEIALRSADLQRARERVAWCERMRQMRYATASDLTRERHNLLGQKVGLEQARVAETTYHRYTVPRMIRSLEAEVESAGERLEFAKTQLERQDSRLAKLRKQIERCTIRAPHGGLVVHAEVLYGASFALREGIQVHQGQPLFYLPDLSTIVATVSLHESVAARVRVGMRARVTMPAFPGREFPGRVTHIDQLPDTNWRAGLDVRHFEAKVTLDQAPRGILPEMSAEVRIVTAPAREALVVPSEALTVYHGRPYCYVASAAGLERRAVALRRAGPDVLEVVGGLSEGEDVVLHPAALRERPADVLPRWESDPTLEAADAAPEANPSPARST